jgi:DNA-binding GntR family transcriptional regulator
MAKVNHTDKVRAQLIEKLTFGEYPPGHTFKLKELLLDPEFSDMSQTPIREALLQLCATNILIGQRGFSVRVPIPSAEHLAEVRQIRTNLELMAATQHMHEWDDSNITELEDIHQKMMLAKADRDIKNQLRQNALFHMRLCNMESDSYLKSIIKMLWAITGPSIGYLYGDSKTPVFTGKHPHEEIIEAIRKHDAKALEKALFRDLNSTGTRIIEALKASLSPEALTLQPFRPMSLVRERTRQGRALKSTK